MRRARKPRVIAVAALAATIAAAGAGVAAAAGLPSVSSGARPGPDVLYAPPPPAPQLENTGPWKAAPILVSGVQAYRGGEWLYQDFLYDDHGAGGVREPDSPMGPSDHLFSPPTGTLTYPTDPVYANNAADLVELRVRKLPGATALRVTLNTLIAADKTAFTVALGSSPAAVPWPRGAGVRSPAQVFVTVVGKQAEITDGLTGAALGPKAKVTLDLERRQYDVRIPEAAFDPGRSVVRVTIGVGLWDKAARRYLAPARSRTATQPGGASPAGARLFNVGPRLSEPFPDVTQFGAGVTIADAAAGAQADGAWWRERAQADALRLGDVTPFFAEVDFAKLAAGADDDSRVPRTGPINRIFASRFAPGQGVDHARVCFEISADRQAGARCEGRLAGQLQPYALYVPPRSRPSGGWGLTLLLHSLSANYNQYSSSKNQSQLGDRGAGTLVATPAGRGPDGFYAGLAEADAFEVWSDVARHYELDPAWAVVSGYSMGGFGTYRLLARWPDLFARGFSVVGLPGSASDQLESLHNTPVLAWNAVGDELVPITDAEETAARAFALGLEYVFDRFPTADHLTIATNDEYGPGAAFLGEHRADRDPRRVRYVVDPSEDSARGQVVADHAYWLSELRIREPGARIGRIDATSTGFGVGGRPIGPVATRAGTVDGGARGPLPYDERRQTAGARAAAARTDTLVVQASNVARAVVDTGRARLSCAPRLDVRSDGPFDLDLRCTPVPGASAGAGSKSRGPGARVRRCRSRLVLALPRVRGRRVVAVRVTRLGRTVVMRRGGDLRRVVVRRPTLRRFALRLRMQVRGSGRGVRSVKVLRSFPACRR